MTTTHLHPPASYPRVVIRCPFPHCDWTWETPLDVEVRAPSVADALTGTEIRDTVTPSPGDCVPPLPADWAHHIAASLDAAYHRMLDTDARRHLDHAHAGWTLSSLQHLARIARVEPRGDTIAAQSLVLEAAGKLRDLAPTVGPVGIDNVLRLSDQLERFARQLVPAQVPTGPDAADIQFVEHDPNPF